MHPRAGPQLPSIRQLHPYHPPAPTAQEYTPPPPQEEEEQESDREGRDEHDLEPPKKKRRRQALSCTGASASVSSYFSPRTLM